MSRQSILVAGTGNIFCADDAFGVEVIRHLQHHPLPPQVRVVDFGIRGRELAYTLMEHPFEMVILVDTVQRGGQPGTLYVIDPDLKQIADGEQHLVEAHEMDPLAVLRMVHTTSSHRPLLRLVGCEPKRLEAVDDGDPGLSPAVRAAIDGAARLVGSLVEDHLVAAAGGCADA
ncbi:MAG: hydrogenase maturation protease [Phycisphaeraceae bacterium]